MPNHQPNPINPYLAQPLLNKRKNATQACDSCRRRKRQCDAQRPVCSSCQKATLECTYDRNGLKRGRKVDTSYRYPATPWTTYRSAGSSSTNTSNHSTENSNHGRLAAMDPFSREVTDHLIELFFEHSFQDFDFFSPVDFLRQYVQGIVNQDLLHAICASAAPFSDHPAIAKTTPASNGQIYVDRVKARMIHLISQVSVDVVHTLMILARAEYNAGHPQKGFRVEAIAIAMAPELELHRPRRPEYGKPFESEAERIAFEISIRTFGVAAIHDWILSLVQGKPGMLEHIMVEWPTTGFRQGWWIECVSTNGRRQKELRDEYSARILHSILKPSRLKNADFNIHMLQLVDAGRLVKKFCQHVSSLGWEDQSSGAKEGVERTDSTATTSKMTASKWQDFQEEYRQAQDALEQWRATLPQDLQPSRAKDMVSRLETYGFVLAGYYYVLVIQLHRPFLLKACMAISSRKKRLAAGAEIQAGVDVQKEKLEQHARQSEQQTLETCLNKCLAAADEFVAIIEQFTDEDIRFRGDAFSFPAFIVGTVYIIQGIVDETSKGVQTDKDKLAICRRFLRMLGKYYGSAVEPELLLGRFSPAKVAEAEVGGISTSTSSSLSTIEMVPDIALSSPSVEAEEVNDFEMLWIEGLNAEEAEEWKRMSHLFGLTAADLQHQEDDHGAEVEEDDAYPVKWSFAQQVVSDPVEATLFSTATASVTAPPATTATRVSTSTSISDDKTQQEALGGDQVEAKNAFFTTDSGLGTLWLHPEKMASLEEATISSFEKLSMR